MGGKKRLSSPPDSIQAMHNWCYAAAMQVFHGVSAFGTPNCGAKSFGPSFVNILPLFGRISLEEKAVSFEPKNCKMFSQRVFALRNIPWPKRQKQYQCSACSSGNAASGALLELRFLVPKHLETDNDMKNAMILATSCNDTLHYSTSTVIYTNFGL